MLGRREVLAGAAAVGVAGALGSWSAYERLSRRAGRALSASPADAIPRPDPGASLDVLVVGDVGSASPVRARVAAAMLQTAETVRPRLVVLTGDNAYPRGFASVDDRGWQRHFTEPFGALAALAPFYPCLGNHDHHGSVQAQIDYGATHDRWRMPAPYHAFEAPVPENGRSADGWSAELFVLDTTPLRGGGINPFRRPAQIEWLEDALRRSTAAWKIVVGHHPILSGGPKGGSRILRWYLSPLFARYAVDLYLSGHDHDLELLDSGRGWLQVVSGAGSAPERAVARLDSTVFASTGGGFVWLSLRRTRAWIQFRSPAAVLATFAVERGTAA